MQNQAESHQIFSNFINKTSEATVNVDETVNDRFYKERNGWLDEVTTLSQRIRNVEDLADLQVDVYSTRQKLVEYYHYLSSLIGKKNAEIRKRKRERFEFYTSKYDLKLDKDQKEMYIMVDLEDLYMMRDAMENHMKYISSTITTVDNIVYGIKHRITLEEYKRRL